MILNKLDVHVSLFNVCEKDKTDIYQKWFSAINFKIWFNNMFKHLTEIIMIIQL